jgi:hypothetical protein
MADMFSLDLVQIEKLKKLYKQFPKEFARASANVINKQAFDMKDNYLPKAISDLMTVRSPGFIKSSIRYTKSPPRSDINKQVSIVGTIEKNNFTGLKEQELGTKTERRKKIDIAARGRKWKDKVKSKFRLKPGKRVYKRSDFDNVTIPQFLQIMNNKQYRRELFMIDEHYDNLKRGTYIINSKGKLIRIYSTEGNLQPKRIYFMKAALKRIKNSSIVNRWNKEMQTIFNKKI